jgi:prepilin-type processing-associated H-X9-DG protein
VCLIVIGILAAVLVPAGLMVRRMAVATACGGNLRQVGLTFHAYAQNWDSRYPAEGNLGVTDARKSPAWFDRLPEYHDRPDVRRFSVFQCSAYRWAAPGAFTSASPKSFKMNSYLDDDGRPRHYLQHRAGDEGEMVLMVDALAGETGMGQWGYAMAKAVTDARHPGRVNVLHLDGHSQTRTAPPADGDWKKALRWLSENW